MPEFHDSSPIFTSPDCLPHLRLIAWGAFYFRVRTRGGWKLVDDRDLAHVHPPRRDSIGVRSAPYGPARVTATHTGQVATAPPKPPTTGGM